MCARTHTHAHTHAHTPPVRPCSILYQRGIYPPESFSSVPKYGMPLPVTRDEGLRAYLSRTLAGVRVWLAARALRKMVLVVAGCDTKEVRERWVFNVDTDEHAAAEAEAG